MLTHIQITDFTLVDRLELELRPGLTVLTGETGAGKSILLGALGLAIGDRADANKVRAGAARAEVCASFELTKLPRAIDWLKQNELLEPEGEQECILRRVLTNEGRSRAFINGQTVTISQLRELGEILLNIHSQHEHQALLKPSTHKYFLDEYAGSLCLAQETHTSFNRWQAIHKQLEEARNNSEEENAKYQLLKYQVEELDELALEENEVENLEQQQKALANAEQLISVCQSVSNLCDGIEDSITNQLNAALSQLRPLSNTSTKVNDAMSMLDTALIQVQEASSELEHQAMDIDESGMELQNIEQRLSFIYDIARKHRVQPEALYQLHQEFGEQLEGLKTGDERLEQLESELSLALSTYAEHASKLSITRQKAAKKLIKAINSQLKNLSMEQAKFDIALTKSEHPTAYGNESIEFLISTIPGKAPLPLNKVASGGELSRVSLAIQVITAQTSTTPTLVFDEVDVGIGGVTGDKVGQQLRKLGDATQVLCVTHLAQVASKAHQHLKVNKTLSSKKASSQIEQLEGENKIHEIARMMGGDAGSEQSLAHAREMIAAV